MQRVRILAAVVAAIVGVMLGVNPAWGATTDIKTSGLGLGPFPYAPDEVLVKFKYRAANDVLAQRLRCRGEPRGL